MNRLNFKILILISTFFPLFLAFFNSQIVLAHILETDGSIGAIIHIDPGDDPIANESAGIYLEFKDRDDKFKVPNCKCVVTISLSGKEIFNQPISVDDSNPTSGNINFTFPQKGIYNLQITGNPNQPNYFQPFILKYEIRVSRSGESDTSDNNGFLPPAQYLLIGVILIMLLTILIFKVLKVRR